jgi:hypothetical protein
MKNQNHLNYLAWKIWTAVAGRSGDTAFDFAGTSQSRVAFRFPPH